MWYARQLQGHDGKDRRDERCDTGSCTFESVTGSSSSVEAVVAARGEGNDGAARALASWMLLRIFSNTGRRWRWRRRAGARQ